MAVRSSSSSSSSSSCSYQDQRRRSCNGGTESRKNTKKLRSIKLSKLPSLNKSARRSKSRFDFDLPTEDASPKIYNQSMDHVKNYSFQEGSEFENSSISSSTNGSSVSTPSFKDESMEIRTDTQTKMTGNNFGSNKTSNSRGSRSSRSEEKSGMLHFDVILPDNVVESVDSMPNYLRGTSSSDEKRIHIQLSSHNFESGGFDTSDYSASSSQISKSISASQQRSARLVMGRASLKSVRLLKNTNSFKSKRVSMNRSIGSPHDSNLNRATCSSALKCLKLPKHGQKESEGVSVMKVCPYHHCSLHGHSHESLPPVKNFISKRRRSLKAQKSMKSRCQPTSRRRRSIDRNEELQTSLVQAIATASKAESLAEKDKESGVSVESDSKSRIPFSGGDEEKIQQLGYVNILFGESSYPKKGDLTQVKIFFGEEQHNLDKKHAPTSVDSEEAAASNPLCNRDNDSIPEDKYVVFNAASSPLQSLKTGEQYSDGEKNSESYEPGSEFVAPCYSTKESQFKAISHKPYNHPLGKEKHVSMWYLIHQHMVSGVDTEAEKPMPRGPDEEIKAKDDTIPTSISISDLGSGPSKSSMGMPNYNLNDQEIELQKMYAVKVVREAFEKILLPEVQDQISGDQSVKSDATLEPEVAEINHEEGFANDRLNKSDQNEGVVDKSHSLNEASLVADGSPVEEKIPSKLERKSGRPNSWSNLTKLLLLRRFINELEKVTKIESKTRSYLSVEPEHEPEKVSLRQGIIGGRRSTEEWMLDYALQQVVSQLAPTQKKKVSLLVQAFETVAPTQEGYQNEVPFPKLFGRGRNDSHNRSELGHSVSLSTGGRQNSGQFVASSVDNWNSSSTPSDKHLNTSVLSTATVDASESSLKLHEIEDSINLLPTEKNIQLRVHEDALQRLKPEVYNGTFGLGDKNVEPGEMRGTDKACYTIQSSILEDGRELGTTRDATSISESDTIMYASSAAMNYSQSKGHTIQKGSESDESSNWSSKQLSGGCLSINKNIGMWHMIYQHVASRIAEKAGNQLLLDEADSEEERDASNIKSGAFGSDSYPGAGSDTIQRKISLTKTEAIIKLVKEAVDEILQPEIQDDMSDTQSSASDILPDQDFLENISSDVVKGRIEEHDRNKVQEDLSLYQAEKSLADNITDQAVEKSASTVNKKPEQMAKNWSKLKKLILLKKCMKALERSRNFISQTRQDALAKMGQGAEKIDLKHRMLEERKKAEQWMLDYAVQHIVTKLTPARKRRVSMLVEAFEAVVPLPAL